MISSSLESAFDQYANACNLSGGTRNEYHTTLRKWQQWGGDLAINKIGRKELREFLDWVYEQAVGRGATNPGRTSNKARENLRALICWAFETDIIAEFPRFPKPKMQRSVAGRHYLTKSEINSLYFATYRLTHPSGRQLPYSVGHYWRVALVLFYNYGLDTGTVWGSKSTHEPILWRHVTWDRKSPDGLGKQESRWGWISYRRVKTGKWFVRPMNRSVYLHLKNIKPLQLNLQEPLVLGGGSRPNVLFKQLCDLAHILPKANVDSGNHESWLLKDLRKTCATYYDQHMPESSVEILGHSVGGVTYKHYAHRDPLAFRAITTISQPTAFLSLAKGFDGECPCCRRRFI